MVLPPQALTQMPDPVISGPYQACLELAQQQAVFMAQRWYTLLAGKLLDQSTSSMNIPDKRQIHEAWVALTTQQAAIEKGFAPALVKAVAQEIGGGSAQSARSMNLLRFDDLELMGEEQVQDTLDAARLQQVFLLASDAGFAGFSARLSTAQGYRTVKTDKNPLRPEIIARALANTLQALPVAVAIRARWLVYGGQIMGDLLQQLYAQLQDLLEKQGVQPAAYQVTSAPDEHARGSSPARQNQVQTESPSAGHEIYLPREKLLTLNHLHRLMSGEYDDSFSSSADALMSLGGDSGQADPVFAQGFSDHGTPSVSAALGVLAELKKKGAGNTSRTTARSLSPESGALMRQQLKTDPRSMGQSLAIEVVGLMIEQVSSDSRLLAPVRQVIANAEPAFLRIGMSDPRFFSDKNHPARRLLETITAKSLAFDHEGATGFGDFMLDLQKVAALLTHEQASNAQYFEMLVQKFETRQAERGEAAVKAQKQAVLALLQAEQRNLLAGKIAVEIVQRNDFSKDNTIITAFVTGPWAQVMAKERLLGDHSGAQRSKAVYSLALGDMLWSIDFAQASRHRKRLVKIIPNLLNVLREGLLSIDYPLAQSKVFFDELMRLHEQSLIGVAAPAKPQGNKLDDLEKAFANGDAGSSTQPWLDPTEAQQSGFMDYVDDAPKLRFEATVPQSQNNEHRDLQVDDEPAQGVRPFMLPGAWVDLVADDQWIRAQLTWISPHNTLFMFTSHSGRSHSMTGRMLEQLTHQGRFKVISQNGIVNGAFDNVAQTAMRNSMQYGT